MIDLYFRLVPTVKTLSVALILSLYGFTAHGMADLEFQAFTGELSGIGEISVVILGAQKAALIDAPWLLGDGAVVADELYASGRNGTGPASNH